MGSFFVKTTARQGAQAKACDYKTYLSSELR